MEQLLLITAILVLVAWIALRLEVKMATKDELLEHVANIRSDIQKLKDQIAAGGMSAAEEEEVRAALAALAGENE